MFPLGTALLPGGELPLRVFEPRYRQMLTDHIEESDGRSTVRFGVVLIARGSEVGGGEVRRGVGTMARADVTERHPDGRALLSGSGTHRFRVVEWLPDDPYPLARVEVLPEPSPTDADLERLHSIDQRLRAVMRQTFEAAGKDVDTIFAALDIIDADPLTADLSPVYRWANRLQIEPHDQQRLLEAVDPSGQLDVLDDVMEGLEARAAFGRG
ncbi:MULTISPECIES: LON peptidase substrate-binding domain-containing protein [Gordonia]|uniref:LON peptidase substrate-binding domain-containing protein n=1 Tax=Gordonia amicalis TaxID=89053 RepID=A0AAE4UAL8_9ACTN|nr:MULTISPECIES: LON peptidase substrate-binding domain-containing protein [Gordonia]ATD69594.1 peptidase S16 [Gordonia sp. 1D]MBA5848945.1 LON peptidase substrate-binding domain-containing protein [Gordonia amicalis]MCZ4580031.1 LON peptidase substrate-binding domain-containing protein [Gordonia amicalis]MDJ0455483.1 LON peptidase substrate-binding domain-containing protein [Gordonia amicalis]MDV6308729.1 LON peptidase substrate-binding domain-containing protein [Gordonia amicalis]